VKDKNVHHTNEPSSCEDTGYRGIREESSMPCTINSSPARAPHACRQTTGKGMEDALGEKKSVRGFDLPKGLSRVEI
jgi:hypothetical protein